jgi:hypothetical protein
MCEVTMQVLVPSYQHSQVTLNLSNHPVSCTPVKAPEGWRSPGRFAQFVSCRQTLRVLECNVAARTE